MLLQSSHSPHSTLTGFGTGLSAGQNWPGWVPPSHLSAAQSIGEQHCRSPSSAASAGMCIPTVEQWNYNFNMSLSIMSVLLVSVWLRDSQSSSYASEPSWYKCGLDDEYVHWFIYLLIVLPLVCGASPKFSSPWQQHGWPGPQEAGHLHGVCRHRSGQHGTPGHSGPSAAAPQLKCRFVLFFLIPK